MYNPAHPFSTSLNDFITSCNLVSTFSRMASFHVDSTFTRHDSRSKSLLDYVFVSRGIIDSVTNVSIGDYHDNHSDHLPVKMELSLHIPSLNDRNKNYSKNYNGIIWSKLSSIELYHFSSTMETALDHIDIPNSILHGYCLCQDDSHKFDLELYFSRIIDCIMLADSVLERSCFCALKPYWSPELSQLKQQSYISHKAWLDHGRPALGLIHDNYLVSRSNYRRKLRQEKRMKNFTRI